MQRTLVAIWRELPGLRDPDRFEAWTYRMALPLHRRLTPHLGADWHEVEGIAPVPRHRRLATANQVGRPAHARREMSLRGDPVRREEGLVIRLIEAVRAAGPGAVRADAERRDRDDDVRASVVETSAHPESPKQVPPVALLFESAMYVSLGLPFRLSSFGCAWRPGVASLVQPFGRTFSSP